MSYFSSSSSFTLRIKSEVLKMQASWVGDLALGVFLVCLPHCFLKQGLSLNMTLTDSARLASPRNLPAFASLG